MVLVAEPPFTGRNASGAELREGGQSKLKARFREGFCNRKTIA